MGKMAGNDPGILAPLTAPPLMIYSKGAVAAVAAAWHTYIYIYGQLIEFNTAKVYSEEQVNELVPNIFKYIFK